MKPIRSPRGNPLGSEQASISRRDQEALRWVSARPAGPVRRLSPEEIARMEAERTRLPSKSR